MAPTRFWTSRQSSVPKTALLCVGALLVIVAIGPRLSGSASQISASHKLKSGAAPSALPIGIELKDGLHVTVFDQRLAAVLGIPVREAISCRQKSSPATLGWSLEEWQSAVAEPVRYRAGKSTRLAVLGKLRLDQPALWYDQMPQMVPCGGSAPHLGDGLMRYGGDGDGGKWLCQLGQPKAPCLIYSLGSYGEIDFEEAMIAATPCDVWSFDCTVPESRMPKQLHPRIHFEATCIGPDTSDGKFQSLATISKRLKHPSLSLLKMDIEGYEFGVMSALRDSAAADFRGSYAFLPMMISFESHLHTRSNNVSERAIQLDGMFQDLLDMGYLPVSREYNLHCSHCEEFVFVRLAAECYSRLPIYA